MKRRSLLKALGLAPLAGLFAREVAAEPVPSVPTEPRCPCGAVGLHVCPILVADGRAEAAFGLPDCVAGTQAISLDQWRAKHGGASSGAPRGNPWNDGLEHDVAFSVPCAHEWEQNPWEADWRPAYTCSRCGAHEPAQKEPPLGIVLNARLNTLNTPAGRVAFAEAMLAEGMDIESVARIVGMKS